MSSQISTCTPCALFNLCVHQIWKETLGVRDQMLIWEWINDVEASFSEHLRLGNLAIRSPVFPNLDPVRCLHLWFHPPTHTPANHTRTHTQKRATIHTHTDVHPSKYKFFVECFECVSQSFFLHCPNSHRKKTQRFPNVFLEEKPGDWAVQRQSETAGLIPSRFLGA